MLDDLKGGVDAGGFGEGIHEGIVLLMEAENLEYILVSTIERSSEGFNSLKRKRPGVNRAMPLEGGVGLLISHLL